MPLPGDRKSCIEEELRRWEEGKLHSGSTGKVVKDRKQAIAIALSSCSSKSFAEKLEGLGFSKGTSTKVKDLLFRSPDWKDQFLGEGTGLDTPKENKTTLAPSLPGFDIDNDPGKQPGSQGKHKCEESSALFPVSLPRGNPQPGPRSKSGKALSSFGEK